MMNTRSVGLVLHNPAATKEKEIKPDNWNHSSRNCSENEYSCINLPKTSVPVTVLSTKLQNHEAPESNDMKMSKGCLSRNIQFATK